jgi:uncharacterized SAM-binding protein YcdF (DUF218 family)
MQVLRQVRRLGVAALAGLLVWALIGLPFLAFPQEGPPPKHADVVLVLGPPVAQRVAVAERLLRAGTVDTALVSVPYDVVPPRTAALCARPHVICFDPAPRTTRGEARALRRYAARDGWTSAVVVSMTAHLSRARSIVGRCFSGRLTMLPSGEPPYGGWAYQYAYQSAATVKSWLLPGC